MAVKSWITCPLWWGIRVSFYKVLHDKDGGESGGFALVSTRSSVPVQGLLKGWHGPVSSIIPYLEVLHILEWAVVQWGLRHWLQKPWPSTEWKKPDVQKAGDNWPNIRKSLSFANWWHSSHSGTFRNRQPLVFSQKYCWYKLEAYCGTNGRRIVAFLFHPSLAASKAQHYKWGACCGTNWRCTAVLFRQVVRVRGLLNVAHGPCSFAFSPVLRFSSVSLYIL